MEDDGITMAPSGVRDIPPHRLADARRRIPLAGADVEESLGEGQA
jgi:hypothetical protein